ncbi:hypothetical protein CLU79DRAFT_692039 [Phycomyces nitens]|nr:hypothetical protein CLU79DRAFT_692039 [Phycomyces nitens]
MFMRLIILESDKNSRWIKVVGVLLITFRFADWPYELAYNNVKEVSTTIIGEGTTCWASWGNGVLIVNFIADTLATLFLSGMFVRRLYIHINTSKSFISQQNRTIEYIARKSLWCLVLTFVVNFIMNILKVTSFLNDRSDAFTVYFELIESTLLVEALRFDQRKTGTGSFCDNCGMVSQHFIFIFGFIHNVFCFISSYRK